MSSYCYVGRYNDNKVFINENIDAILMSIYNWSTSQRWPKVPNQIDDKYYVIDIGCSTDVALMSKHYDWNQVFEFFNAWPKIKSTFATKYPTRFKAEQYNLYPGKHRLRVSLMPQVYSDILEPNTDSIDTRISMIPKLQQKMEVHINFSPIIYHDNWLENYRELFEKLKGIDFKSECIFLTYNNIQFLKNSEQVNEICWKPDIQERKDSQYAADNLRYKWDLKAQMIKDFKALYSEYFELSTIRYIF